MYFDILQHLLVEIARERIHSGKFSERRLAGICGVSQSHMHNILSEIRWPSNSTADRMLRALEMEIPDLIARLSMQKSTAISIVPTMRARIGPGAEADLAELRGYVPLASSLVAPLIMPVAAWLGSDLVLPRELAPLDLVLLDQNPLWRAAPGSGLWVVAEGSGLRVRYLSVESGRLSIGNAATREDRTRWLSVKLEGRNILEIVRARIVWIGREMEKAPAGPVDASGAGD